MAELTWENAQWAHGPRLADWLLPRVPATRENRGPMANARRTLQRAREDRAAMAFTTVDRVLIRCGFHAFEVPDGIWIEPDRDPHTGRPMLPDDADECPLSVVRRRILVVVRDHPGSTAQEILAVLGHHHHSAVYSALRAMDGFHVASDRSRPRRWFPLSVGRVEAA